MSTKIKAYRLGDEATKQLEELAKKMHAGNETATLRELIRNAYKRLPK